MRFTLDTATIKTIALAESITHVSIMDCTNFGESIIFIVDEKDLGKALGKYGSNAKMLERLLKKKVKLVGHSEDVFAFVKSLVYPLEIEKKEEKDGILYLTGKDTQTRAMLIGRNASNLRAIEEIVKRYFQIQEIKVVQQ